MSNSTFKLRALRGAFSLVTLTIVWTKFILAPSLLLASPLKRSAAGNSCLESGQPYPRWKGQTALDFPRNRNPYSSLPYDFIPTTLAISPDSKKLLYIAGSVINTSTGRIGIFYSRHSRTSGELDRTLNSNDSPGYKILWTGLFTTWPNSSFALGKR